MSLRPRARVDGGGNDSWEPRLRAVEGEVREIRTRMENSATKTDIAHLKIWVLGGVITTLGGILTGFLWLIQPILKDLVQALIQIKPPG